VVSDPTLARRLGQAARAHATREFSLEACADAYERLYRERTATAREVAK
jgi:glycosyltransferase involved in cell wall biosynthesis